MKVRFLKEWNHKRAGAEADIPDGVANTLIRRKFVEPVVGTIVETAAVEQVMERRAPKRNPR